MIEGDIIFKYKYFYKELIILALPIIMQNLISNIIVMLDTFMLGFVGQNELAAISLANQLYFILSLFFLGLTFTIGILMAQYLGKQDYTKANQIFMISCQIAVVICLIFSISAIVFAETIMSLFTNNDNLIALGSDYLEIVGISYLFIAFSQVYLMVLKVRLQVTKSICISLASLGINFVLNALFIFGLCNFPKWGIIGVAIATCIARLFECICCYIDYKRNTVIKYLNNIAIPRILYKDYCKVGTPIMIQGFVWGGAMTMMSAIIGHLGTDMVAANTIASNVQNIATVISFGLVQAGLILLGKDLGNNQFVTVKEHSKCLLKVSIFFGICCCVLMFMVEQHIYSFLFLTTTVQYYLGIMYKLLAVNVIWASITYTVLCGIFPSGGYTKYGLYIDGIVMWSLISIGSVLIFTVEINPLYIFLIFNLDELIKTPFVLKKYYQYKWLNNITR